MRHCIIYIGAHQQTARKVFLENPGLLADVGVGIMTENILSSVEEFIYRLYGVTQTPSVDAARHRHFSGDILIQDSRSKIPRFKIQDPEIKIQKSRSRNQDPEIKIPKSRSRNQDPEIKIQKSRSRNQDPEIKIQKSRSRNQDPEIKIQKSRSRNQDPEIKIQK